MFGLRRKAEEDKPAVLGYEYDINGDRCKGTIQIKDGHYYSISDMVEAAGGVAYKVSANEFKFDVPKENLSGFTKGLDKYF